MKRLTHRRSLRGILALTTLTIGLPIASSTSVSAVSGAGLINGEIERIVLNSPGDVYAGGQMVVGGQNVIIPRNLLLDLPANRLTLQQLFVQAPTQECIDNHETGLAKVDRCNHTGAGAFASLSANRVATGDVIVGDGLIEKGREAVQGNVTYIDYTGGWFKINGRIGDPTTGVMVRLNDPTSRHTLQSGPGCANGTQNCSADPRFTLDPNNYTNTFTSGYPLCIPSTAVRAVSAVLGDIGPNGGANPLTGIGDAFCPTTNRLDALATPVRVAKDSRLMAPLLLGDPITAEGNYETIGGVHFLSAHTTSVSYGLQTSTAPGQPDYMFLEEAFIDVAGFQNQRARALFIGFATQPEPDVLGWGVHYDPEANAVHELPLASTKGCEVAAGPGTCIGFGIGLFKIRYDSDFVLQPTKPRWSPCAHLNAEPRFGAVCPDANNLGEEEFAILSPVPHEIQFRTGRKVADTLHALHSIDITGAESANGQYLFPFGANLGGINFPEALEFNLDLANQPFAFEGIPWNLDRRLSPGGCQANGAVCESTPQPLIPFPYSEQDPRALAGGAIAAGGGVPNGAYNDPAFTSAVLTHAADRILSFIPNAAATVFGGDASVLQLPTAGAISQGITPTPALTLTGPAVLGFDPPSGQVASMVHVGGLGLDAATGVTINNRPAIFSVISPTRLDVLVPALAPVGPGTLEVQFPGGPVAAPTPFTVVANPNTPTISTFTPGAGDEGSAVTISGTHFTGATSVSFGGFPASFTVDGVGTSITAYVPIGIGAGDVSITVTAPDGTATAANQFTVTLPPPPVPDPPVVTAITPAHALVGTTVTITGLNFLGATGVDFNGVSTAADVVSDTTILATVPALSTTGPVTIVSPNGAGTGLAFTVDAPVAPTAAAITPVAADQSSVVQLNGTGSLNATSFAWTQLTGPTVTLNGANTATPTFTMPALFQDLTFRLTVTNQGLTSTIDVTVTANPGQVTITAGSQFRISKREWRASGTASFPGANTVTVRTGLVVGQGTVIGSVPVDALGAWTMQIRNSLVSPNPTIVGQNTTINVVASRGGFATDANVTVRN